MQSPSIGFTRFILFNVIKSLASILKLFPQSVPDREIGGEDNRKLHAIEHVSEVHHLYFWSLDGEHHVLTAHLVLDEALFRARP